MPLRASFDLDVRHEMTALTLEQERSPFLHTSIKNTLRGELDGKTEGHFIYVVFDENAIFYVGQSQAPVNRLKEHLGARRFIETSLGMLISCNLPVSLNWTFATTTLQGCVPFVEEYLGVMHQRRKAVSEFTGEMDFPYPTNAHTALALYKAYTAHGNRQHIKIVKDIAEKSLIWKLGPCLNKIWNVKRNPLPSYIFDPAAVETLPVVHPSVSEYIKWLIAEDRNIDQEEHTRLVIEAWKKRYAKPQKSA